MELFFASAVLVLLVLVFIAGFALILYAIQNLSEIFDLESAFMLIASFFGGLAVASLGLTLAWLTVANWMLGIPTT